MRALEAEGRTATAEEQQTLAKFTGWGQFPGLFKRYPSEDWAREQEQLKELLSEKEYEAAKDSSDEDDSYAAARKATLNSHFTSPQIVNAHWRIAQRLGFRGGRYLEPSVGSGYYIGMMPPELARNTSVTGVELDKTTAQVAKHLYPSATIKNMGFEAYQAPDGFYDLVASNVPFGDYTLNETRYNKFRAPIHDHFFLKSIDKTRPGGLIMHVTSTGTMDKKSSHIREQMAKDCDLIAAIRLPGKTHQAAANTEVVTDLIILKKRGPHGEAPEETPKEVTAKLPDPGYTGVLTDSLGRVYHFVNGKRVASNHWTQITTVPDPGGGEPIEVNQYFADRPEQILGTLDRSGTMYRSDSKNVTPPADFNAALEAAVGRIPEDVYQPREAPAEETVAPAPEKVKDGAIIVKDGEIWQRQGGEIVKRKVSEKDAERIKACEAIRGPLHDLIDADLSGEPSDEARKALGDAYDAFVAAHGPLHQRNNLAALAEDPEFPLLMSLEKWDAKSGTATKADIFTKNTIRPTKRIESAGTVPEALGVTLNESGRVDIDRIAALTGRPIEDVEDELSDSGTAFQDPEHGWVPRAEYLSGNVRKKLEIARAAAENDPRYLPNVRALEKNQPEDIDHTDISAKLGAPWVPGEDMAAFAAELANTRPNAFHMEYVPQTGQWTVALTKDGRHVDKSQAAAAWSTHDRGFMELLDAAMNNKVVTVTKDVGEGKRVVDAEATENARGKIQDMRDRFADWLWSDDERRQRLFRHYNDNFNNIVPMQYDGSHLDFPGMTPDFKMRDVQKNFVWQVVTRGKGVLAHEVGVGKTATMVASAMELRRLGLAKKPCIACLKSNLEQLTKEAQELYPGARILSTSGMFEGNKRKETISRIATGDYDMVFMSHDHLNLLPMSSEVQSQFVRDELVDLEAALEAAKDNDKSKNQRTVKQLEKRKAQLESELREALGKKKDDAVTFEQTGIDFLMVDEAHKYKSLPVYTSMGQIAGVPQTMSDRATNMLMRTKWLQQQNGGRGVLFATGTPVSNTMAEMYNLQRYIQPEELKSRGLERFDAWAGTFGELETALEPDLKGGYKTKTRFSKFVNIPELMQIVRQDLDVRRAANLKNADGSPAVPRPDRHEHMVLAPESDGIRSMMEDIHARAKEIAGKGYKPEPGADNPLSLTTLGRQGSVDLRLYDAGMPDDPNSKTNRCVKNVLDWYHNPEKAGQTQLIFSDIGVHAAPGGFHLYQDIIDKLVAGGIPRDQIADFGKLEGKAKVEAAQALKAGKMRIGIGSTERLGTGNNVQTYLGAMHHLDIPYVPTALEQRNGRGHRHGNKNKDINIFHYVSEGSLDEMSWGIVSRKANFIAQAITDPKAGAREVTEEDAEALTPQQLMAAASGDTRVLERVNLADTVKNLRRARARHERDQERLKEQISTGTVSAKRLREQAAKVAQDAKHLESGDFHVQLADGRQTTERGPAAEWIESEAARVDAAEGQVPHWKRYELEPTHVGHYRGMPLFRFHGNYTLQGPSGESYQVGDTLPSIEAAARGLAKRAERTKAEAAKIESDLKAIGGQVGKPFSRTDALKKAEADLAALEKDLKERQRGEQPATDAAPEVEKNARERLVDLFRREFARDFYCCRDGKGDCCDLADALRREFAGRGFGGRQSVQRYNAEFEAKHPRADDGKFGEGQGAGGVKVYHGTTMEDATKILANPVVNQFPGLWITDTHDRASRYANARATGEVNFHATDLQPHAAVLEIEHSDPKWSRREYNDNPETATSLDQAEDLIRENSGLRVVGAKIAECGRKNCICHAHAAFARGDHETADRLARAHAELYGPNKRTAHLLKHA